MQISSKEIIYLIGLTSLIFLIAPLFLIMYVISYNRKKQKHQEEKILLQKAFENELLKTQMEVQEQTLKTVAYDLHDNIGQLLSITSITLSAIDLDNDHKDKSREKIIFAEDLANRSIKEVKALSRLLHGEELVNKGLAAAIEFELEWLKRSGKFTIHFEKQNFVSFTNDTGRETIVFRLFQEIINNIIQHAMATEIFITLTQIDNSFKLIIRDNGKGFDVEEALKQKSGMGLHNIIKRAAMIGGTSSVISNPGAGCETIITVPINN
ncbi:MAG TPA: ATP-binding protein [Mucilaginibacter sp.]